MTRCRITVDVEHARQIVRSQDSLASILLSGAQERVDPFRDPARIEDVRVPKSSVIAVVQGDTENVEEARQPSLFFGVPLP